MIYRLLELTRRHSLAVILASTAITVFFGVSLLNIQIDADITSFVADDEEITRLMQEYGGGGDIEDNYLVVAANAPDPFRPEALRVFAEVIGRLEALPEIHPGITPFNLITFAKEGRRLAVRPAAPGGEAPRTEAELSAFRRRLLETPFARNLVVSEDGTTLVGFFPAEIPENNSRVAEAIETTLSDLAPYYTVHITGTIPFMATTESYLSRDLSRLLLFAVVVILSTFYLGFRAARAVFLPLLVVLMGTVWSLGFMSLAGFALTTISVIIPPLVLALGSSYSIHILNQYYREAGDPHKDDKWIGKAIVHVNRTILLASATTVAGLLSLLAVSVKQSREFAAATSVGIIACAVLSLFFLPAVLQRLKAPARKQTTQVLHGPLTRLMSRLAAGALRARYAVAAAALAMVGLFVYSVQRLEYNTDAMSYFPQDASVVRDMRFFTEKIGGFEEIAVTLTAPDGRKDYFLETEVLRGLARIEDRFAALPDVCYVSSFVGYLRHLNDVMNGSYAVPETRALTLLLSRYVRLISAGETANSLFRSLANEDFSAVTVKMRIYGSERGAFIDEIELRALLEQLDLVLDEELPAEIGVRRWGAILRYLSLSNVLQRDSIKSMLIAAAAILIITTVAFRSVLFGLYALIPLAVGVMFNLSFMVVAGIPLDMITIMVSSVAIGVGVDDSIHFLIQYRRQLSENPGDIATVIGNTMRITGRPIVLTTLSIVAGLSILGFAVFRPIIYFGLLVVLTLAATCLGTIIVLPAVLSFRRSAGSRTHRQSREKPLR